MKHWRGLALLSLLFTAGCGGNTGPAPVFHYGDNGGADSAGMHTVVDGDTPWTLAQDYHVSMQEILTVNHLQPPYRLQPGMRIKLPPPGTYRAKPGDTLFSIARTFDVGMSALAQLNGLHAPYAVRPGDTLRLPVSRPAPVVAAWAPSTPSVDYSADNPPYHDEADARTGNALPSWTPASPPTSSPQPFSSPPLPLPSYIAASTAPSSPPASASGGRRLTWPTPAGRAVENRAATPFDAPTSSSFRPPVPDTQNEVASDLAREAPLRHDAPPARIVNVPWSGGAGRFAWPVNGPVLSSYGVKPGGLHNDGVNIQAPRGAPVHAADDGVVVYAGNELKGFGNLILLRHADRWMTAYAHLDRLIATRGQMVRRGTTIGLVGASGGVAAPQLHFEVRHGTEPLDPEVFLARQGT